MWLALQSPEIQNTIRDATGGTTRDSLNIRDLKAIELPVPPFSEQQRITTKVKEIMERVAATKQHLLRVPLILKRFRQAVLAAACSGRLTEDWREGRSGTEDAQTLLSHILSGRKEQWESAQVAKASRRGKKLSGDGWKLKYKQPPTPKRSELEEIPSSWAWADCVTASGIASCSPCLNGQAIVALSADRHQPIVTMWRMLPEICEARSFLG